MPHPSNLSSSKFHGVNVKALKVQFCPYVIPYPVASLPTTLTKFSPTETGPSPWGHWVISQPRFPLSRAGAIENKASEASERSVVWKLQQSIHKNSIGQEKTYNIRIYIIICIYTIHVLYFTLNIKKLIIHHFHKYLDITHHISVFVGSWTKQPTKIAKNSTVSQPWSASAQGLHGRKDPSWAHAPYDQWRLLVPQGCVVSGAWWVSSFQFHPQPKICTHQSGSLKTPISEIGGWKFQIFELPPVFWWDSQAENFRDLETCWGWSVWGRVEGWRA